MEFSTISINGNPIKGVVFVKGKDTIGVEIPLRERTKIRNEQASYHIIDKSLIAVQQVIYTPNTLIIQGRKVSEAIARLDTGVLS